MSVASPSLKTVADVVGLDRKAPSPPPGGVSVAGELTSDERVRDGLRVIREHRGARVASVIHLATNHDFEGDPRPKCDAITEHGTGPLLRELHAQDLHVEQSIVPSTMRVRRRAHPRKFTTEDRPLEPPWAYPEPKLRTEPRIHAGRADIPAVLSRIAGGCDDHTHSIPLAQQIRRINERDLTSRVSSGSIAHGQPILHMHDLIDAIEPVVERRAKLPPDVPILVGEPEPLTYDEPRHAVARLIHGARRATIAVSGALVPLMDVGRAVRFANIRFDAWPIAAPWLRGDAPSGSGGAMLSSGCS